MSKRASPDQIIPLTGRFEAARQRLLLTVAAMHPAHAEFAPVARIEELADELQALGVDQPEADRQAENRAEAAAYEAAAAAAAAGGQGTTSEGGTPATEADRRRAAAAAGLAKARAAKAAKRAAELADAGEDDDGTDVA